MLILPFTGITNASVWRSHTQDSTLTPIKHVVIITMENHSFDNIFGNYPYGGNAALSNLLPDMSMPNDINNVSKAVKLSSAPQGTFSTPDPVEGYTAYHLDWAGGSMDGFRANSGPQSMTYFTAYQMAPEWDIAEEFAIADMYFASALTATIPNRLFQIAGYSPVINDYGLPPYITFGETIFGELQKYGISWSYYVENPQQPTIVLPFIYGIDAYRSHIGSWNEFIAQLSNGTLPAVSYVSPIGGGASGYSQHPSDNMLVGEEWLLYIIDQLMRSSIWNSTALFITYDEGGGYYDHVPPPLLDGQRLGFRVPLFLVSAYAKEDYVSNTVMNHASLIAFIDYNWKLPPLNRFVALSNIPLDMFYFGMQRQPFTFEALGLQVPGEMKFGFSSLNTTSLQGLFPVTPQIPLNSTPYGRYGNSDYKLASDATHYFVDRDVAYTPFYETNWLLIILSSALAASAFMVTARRRHHSP
ncbi:MAG: alkaline phosphatase family protein [Methanomassiliicoccales archaeon]